MARSKLAVLVALILAQTACPSGNQTGKADSARGGTAVTPMTPPTAVPAPDPREGALAAVVLKLLEQDHLLRKKVDDGISRLAFDNYMERLDGGKMFLLESDKKALAKHTDKIDDELRAGSLDLAHDGAKVFAARVAVVETMVAKILAAPMNHTDEEFIEIDPKKVQLAATDKELEERWRRRLELEVLEKVSAMEQRLKPDKDKDANKDDDADPTMPVAQIPTTPEGRETKVREELAKSYAARFVRLRDVGVLDAASDLLNAVSTSLDPHTNYLPPAEKANFDIHMSGSVEGIGAVLREKEHFIEVIELVPGGAAWQQGELDVGDLIETVAAEGKAPVDVFDMKIDEVVKMIRGPKGTVVKLRVKKPNDDHKTISITRDKVVIENAYARGAVLQGQKSKSSYGYIHVPSFYGGGDPGQRTAAEDVKRLLGELAAKRVSGVILDLRGNGGGFLGEAVEMTGTLIDDGPVVMVQNSQGKREVFADKDGGVAFKGPVIVMVDQFSASASEIVAGALQDYKRAVVVGTAPTHGKGTVQTVADLDRATGGQIELGTMKVTTQQFFRVSGSSTQRQGVVPDIVLPNPAGHLETGERELDHAIEWSQIDAVKHASWPATWKTSALAAKSAARIAKHPVLARIATTVQILKTRQKDTRVPLAKPAWEQRRKDLRAALDAAVPDLEKGPARLNVKIIADPHAKAPPPPPAGSTRKADDSATRWQKTLERDPWLEESVAILGDMTGGK